MGPATPQPTLSHLRQTLAEIDPGHAPRLLGEERLIKIAAPIDHVLGGGLACGALHELAPAAPLYLGATSGFGLGAGSAGQWRPPARSFGSPPITRRARAADPMAPASTCSVWPRRASSCCACRKPADVLWAMEEALRCRALACVIAELTGEGEAADLTATRRLALAARDGVSAQNSGFGLLIRHARHRHAERGGDPLGDRCRAEPARRLSAALGRARFDLSLRKNRRGPSGRWIIEWDHHERAFQPAVSVGVAAAAFDRPDRAPLVRAG